MHTVVRWDRDRGGPFVIGMDAEWTKNYRVRNGNVPFCVSIVRCELDELQRHWSDGLKFELRAAYCTSESDEVVFLSRTQAWLRQCLRVGNTLVGHQLSSDLGVLCARARPEHAVAVERARSLWRSRGERARTNAGVFDTRYDLKGCKGESRRLVDVCAEYGLDVTQPELRGSMTKMHREAVRVGDVEAMEKLAVLNIRHSLSSIVLYARERWGSRTRRHVNVNRVLYENLRGMYAYVSTAEFARLV